MGDLDKIYLFALICIVTAYGVLRICHLTSEIRLVRVNERGSTFIMIETCKGR